MSSSRCLPRSLCRLIPPPCTAALAKPGNGSFPCTRTQRVNNRLHSLHRIRRLQPHAADDADDITSNDLDFFSSPSSSQEPSLSFTPRRKPLMWTRRIGEDGKMFSCKSSSDSDVSCLGIELIVTCRNRQFREYISLCPGFPFTVQLNTERTRAPCRYERPRRILIADMRVATTS